jgi:hypothetical protein
VRIRGPLTSIAFAGQFCCRKVHNLEAEREQFEPSDADYEVKSLAVEAASTLCRPAVLRETGLTKVL